MIVLCFTEQALDRSSSPNRYTSLARLSPSSAYVVEEACRPTIRCCGPACAGLIHERPAVGRVAQHEGLALDVLGSERLADARDEIDSEPVRGAGARGLAR